MLFFLIYIYIFRLLGLLHAKPDDEILLKYWMTSLSKSYRLQLLSGSFSSVT